MSLMNVSLYSKRISKLLISWLVIPILITFLTYLGFMAILQYYAPYGNGIVIPLINKFSESKEFKAIAIYDNHSVIQPFKASLNGLGRIDLQMLNR